MSVTVQDVAWIAGLLEGEGCFGYNKSPSIQLSMTDRDIVERAATIMGVKVHNHVKRRDGYKDVFTCRAHGMRAIGWMQTILVFMGNRRRGRIAEVIRTWRAAPGKPKASKGARFKASCHPNKNVIADELCNSCYMRRYRARRKEQLAVQA